MLKVNTSFKKKSKNVPLPSLAYRWYHHFGENTRQDKKRSFAYAASLQLNLTAMVNYKATVGKVMIWAFKILQRVFWKARLGLPESPCWEGTDESAGELRKYWVFIDNLILIKHFHAGYHHHWKPLAMLWDLVMATHQICVFTVSQINKVLSFPKEETRKN